MLEEQTSDLELASVESDEPIIRNRNSILALIFPDKPTVKTLVDLSVCALALYFGPDPVPEVAKDPVKLKLHYETVDVDLPLHKCYHVTNELYWIRVVIAKHPDKSMPVRKNVIWKNVGVSLKFVEIIENETVEYWPEAAINELAKRIEPFINTLNIKHLKSLRQKSFEKHINPPSSSEDDEDEDFDEISESSVPTSEEEPEDENPIPEEEKTPSLLEVERHKAEDKARRKRDRQILREQKANLRMERLARKERREARRRAKEEAAMAPVKKKKRKRHPKNFLGLEISEDDEEDKDKNVLDRRNLEMFLNSKKNYRYPSKDCHHGDLRFIQHFKCLDTLVIEFRGHLLGRNYHQRHFNFSHQDISRLSDGIKNLPVLRVFRLRNSQMDPAKLAVLVRGLGTLPRLEIVDFGFDSMTDECSSGFYDLFDYTSSVKSLELESNNFGIEVMRTLGESLHNYKRQTLEHLGLSRNPINDNSLHVFLSFIIGTEHVSSLGLRGIMNLSSKGFECCIIDELMGQHSVLRKLDLTGVQIPKNVVDSLIKALTANQKILEFGAFGCGLDEESEMDVSVLVRRNNFIAENPYIGDQTKTNEEIDAWLNETRNPIMLQIFAEREHLTECPTNVFKQFMPTPEPTLTESASQESSKSEHSTELEGEFEEGEDADGNIIKLHKPKKPKKQRPKIFIDHPYVDPEANNAYLKNFKDKFEVWNQLKNLSFTS